MLRLTGDEVVDRLGAPHGVEPFDGEALVVVDDGTGADLPAGLGAAALVGRPAVVVGVDLTVAGDDELAAVRSTVEAHPEAAVALAVLLRTPLATIADGLVAESATYALLQGGADHRRWLASRSRPAAPADDEDRDPPVLVRRDGDVVRITLNRPDRRNAYTAAMRDALVEALDVVAADPAATAVVDGRGPAFCAGGDLTEFGTATDPPAAHVTRLRRSAGRAIADIADRVTVVVHGACVGAGVELPAFAGRVEATPDAWFALPEVSMGLVPGAGGTVSLPRRIGPQRTLWLALTGARLPADRALEWGLVDEILVDEITDA